jgi:uncharacterized protein YeaO (DUF488 family)
MAVKVVRLGSPRGSDEGIRLGTVRHPPRGVKKDDYAKRDFFDVWLPDLAPSAELLSWARSEPLTAQHWKTFARRYRREMGAPATKRLIALLAALSKKTDFAIGCYCSDELRCHRSLLAGLLREAGASVASPQSAAKQ